MKQIKLDEYSARQQQMIEALGYTIVMVMFKQAHVIVIVK